MLESEGRHVGEQELNEDDVNVNLDAANNEEEALASQHAASNEDAEKAALKRKRKKQTLGDEECQLARRGGQGALGRSDIEMRKKAVELKERGWNIGAIISHLNAQYPNTKIPGKRAIQKWIKEKEEVKAQRMRRCGGGPSPAAQLNAILHEQLKDFEASGGVIKDDAILRLAQHIVQQKGRAALGMSSERDSSSLSFNFGPTWLQNFKTTYGWQRRVVHGEAGV